MRKFVLFFLTLFLSFSLQAFAKPRPISEIQGEKQTSPLEGKEVEVQGIVTARVRNGFYIQTPDGQDDKNPRTSEAILIFTGREPSSDATIGNLVEVSGTVVEFRPKSEPVTLPITEITIPRGTDGIKVISKNIELPKPVVLTAVDLDPRGKLDDLERYEGMRIKITSLTVTAPTGGRGDEKTGTSQSDGTFFGVLTGTPRPFREPGFEPFEAISMKPPKTILIFDGNPESLRVDSDAQLGASAIDVAAGATIKNLIGVLDYQYRAWTLFPDANSSPVVSGNVAATAVRAPQAGEFTVAAANLERFFDDTDEPSTDEPILTKEAFQNRLKKTSIFVRDYLKTPDVLSLIEIENFSTLKRLAEKINSDAGDAKVKYEAFIEEGNDIGGIDSGFLVNTARVSVLKTEQFYKTDEYKRPSDDKKVPIFDRPPFLVQGNFKDGDKNLTFTVVVNHLKSLRGYFDANGDTRAKKKVQADLLAQWIQKRQTAVPNEPLILVGDFNAFQFNDGVVDVIGTLIGKPAPKEQLLLASDDVVNPDLTNLVNLIPREQRYSYIFAGNAQVLDHFLVNEAGRKRAARFGFARVNADFPEIYRNDFNRAERISDHDAAVGYFSISEVTAN
ncbi:MAG: hypothetical protein M3209_18315 [Acidobacteriota bacterium]|nr:hypothetical protein [Acidobacteriota bacterium]